MMMTVTIPRRCILPFVAALPTFAQGGSILGHVADPRGNVVPQAVVSLTSASNKSIQQVRTGNEGQFTFSGLPAGKYTLKLVVTGFEPATRTLLVGDSLPLTIDIHDGKTGSQKLCVRGSVFTDTVSLGRKVVILACNRSNESNA